MYICIHIDLHAYTHENNTLSQSRDTRPSCLSACNSKELWMGLGTRLHDIKTACIILVVMWEGVSPCSLYPSSPAHTHHSDIMRKLSMQNWSTPTDKMGDEIHELTTSSVNDCIHVYRIKKHCKQPKQLLNQFNLSEKVHIRIDRYTMYNTSVMHGLLGWAWAEKALYPRPSRGRERKAVQWNQN